MPISRDSPRGAVLGSGGWLQLWAEFRPEGQGLARRAGGGSGRGPSPHSPSPPGPRPPATGVDPYCTPGVSWTVA